MNWRENLISTSTSIRDLLIQTHRIAVLGMRPDRYPYKPAFYVPAALADLGLEIIPIPVHDRDVHTILGRPIYLNLAAIPGRIDLVNVFRRSQDIATHLDDMLTNQPDTVWFQSGIRNDQAAEVLARRHQSGAGSLSLGRVSPSCPAESTRSRLRMRAVGHRIVTLKQSERGSSNSETIAAAWL
jgi:predicted CoA-binding protein